MLVYGDREEAEDPRFKLARLEDRLEALAAHGQGLQRHARLVSGLIEAGELVQGLADQAFEARGEDAPSPAADAAMALCMTLARAVKDSWTSDFAASFEPPRSALTALGRHLPASPLRIRVAEGYAFYALYPEAYLEAALAIGPAPDARILGLRSIGAGLAAVVAAGLGADRPITARPIGHPFRRRLSLAPELKARLSGPASVSAVVDEGPGLSGSSFGAAIEAIEAAGAPAPSLHLFPSHAGSPGAEASPALRRRWPELRRHVVGFEALVLDRHDARGLERWALDLTGEPEAPLEDISAGAWRGRLYRDEADWPAVWPAQERRKYLLRTGSGTWLLKFAGLGKDGEVKLARAKALEAGGFGPQILGLRHGFLAQRWIEGAQPLVAGAADPEVLVPWLGRYLGFRARRFPAPPGAGADPEALCRMTLRNTAEALGEHKAARLEAWRRRLPRVAAMLRPVQTDGRLHAWEWLRAPDGRLVKADAVDHCRSHDLIGCQDIAWDITGAEVELGLSEAEVEALRRRVEAENGAPIPPESVHWLGLPYLAFQLGRCVLAAQSCADWPRESERLKAEIRRYGSLLERRIEAER